MTAYGSIPVAVEAMRLGAFDFVTKPFRNEDVFPLLARIERRSGRRRPAVPRPPSAAAELDQAVVGQSAGHGPRQADDRNLCPHRRQRPALRRDRARARTSSPASSTASPTASRSPTSRSAARSSRRNSSRANSTATKRAPSPAPTSAARAASIWPRAAPSISTTSTTSPWRSKSKLLRAIEEKVFERVGGSAPIKADVRIIASTKRNLLEKIAEGTFRQDLYYRLDVLRVNIPPLRERLEDVPLLAEHLLGADRRGASGGARRRGRRSAHAPQLAGQCPRVVPHPGAGLPGGLRTHHRRATGGRDRRLHGRRGRGGRQECRGRRFPGHHGPDGTGTVGRALRTAGGNKTAAAAALGMKPSTFRDKLAKHGLG